MSVNMSMSASVNVNSGASLVIIHTIIIWICMWDGRWNKASKMEADRLYPKLIWLIELISTDSTVYYSLYIYISVSDRLDTNE